MELQKLVMLNSQSSYVIVCLSLNQRIQGII
ncbi:unnamed protein product [Linum tenue]|uniref:Uncharacterized protein n=1 Tax=Linum tenue TaxID=586396 RepID=A0AAV0PM85_9ROSI|nr:unnamed protein product [Linum tenue]